jgi:hypothetical protein
MGGNAGNSADITVLVKEEDMDLLSLLGQTSNCVPKGGSKGDFGLGGAGGIGGRGGASYSGHNGERSYTNAGGMNGPNGVAGMNGELLRRTPILCGSRQLTGVYLLLLRPRWTDGPGWAGGQPDHQRGEHRHRRRR